MPIQIQVIWFAKRQDVDFTILPIPDNSIPSTSAKGIVYTFTGAEGNDFTVTMPGGVSIAPPYCIAVGVVNILVGGITNFCDVLVPNGPGDRSATAFRCIVSVAQADAGSQLEFLITSKS